MTSGGKSHFKPTLHASLTSKALIVHANDVWYDYIQTGNLEFFEKLGSAAQSLGYLTPLLHSERVESSLAFAFPRAQHIVFGPKRHNGPNIFHAHPSYIPGFWYLDAQGYFWNSTLVDQVFDPSGIDIEKALHFFRGVRGHIFRNNQSKRPQPDPLNQPLPRARVAYFVQDIEKYKKRSWYISTHDILQTLGEGVSGTCYVKLHPILAPDQRRQILDHCARFPNLRVIDASVHDIIKASDVIVSQNSAVGFESLFYEKPVITCAQTDYHHATLVARSPAQLSRQIGHAEQALEGFAFRKYLYWFLNLNMLEPHKDEFVTRAVSRLGLR